MRKYFLGILSFLLVFPASSAFAEIDQAEFKKALDKFLSTPDGQKTVAEAAEKHFKKRQEKQRAQQAKKQEQEMEEQFKNPVVLPVGGSPFKGPEDAKVTIFEFSDFECPFCSRGKSTMAEIRKKYPKDVRVVFKNLPLSFHKNAKPAAQAALAAHKQGKFWEMYDILFTKQRELSQKTYDEAAKKLGLDLAKFKADFSSPEVMKQIEEDEKLAAKHNIRGTPGFFVNGVAVRGAYPVEHFEKIIDRWLEKG